MPAFLVPVDPGHCLIPIEKAVVLIGRQADCDVSLTHSRKISRKHCCIAQVNNTFIVRDLGSTNGVFLNGNRINKEAIISVGDELIIGDIHFQVQSEAPVAIKNKKGKNNPNSTKPLESLRAVPPIPPLAKATSKSPAKREFVHPDPSLEMPIAIPEGDLDFDVEETKAVRPNASRKHRMDDVVPLDEDDMENA